MTVELTLCDTVHTCRNTEGFRGTGRVGGWQRLAAAGSGWQGDQRLAAAEAACRW